jgi:hypothetical protein
MASDTADDARSASRPVRPWDISVRMSQRYAGRVVGELDACHRGLLVSGSAGGPISPTRKLVRGGPDVCQPADSPGVVLPTAIAAYAARGRLAACPGPRSTARGPGRRPFPRRRHDAHEAPGPDAGQVSATAQSAGPPEPSLGFERVVFFSDAVVAIVMTLVVLPLTAEIQLPEGEGSVLSEVLSHWLTVLTFGVSFLVVGQFWIAHHRTFGNLRGTDHGLLWFTLVVLMTVALLPFPAASSAGGPRPSTRSRWSLRGKPHAHQHGHDGDLAVRRPPRTGGGDAVRGGDVRDHRTRRGHHRGLRRIGGRRVPGPLTRRAVLARRPPGRPAARGPVNRPLSGPVISSWARRGRRAAPPAAAGSRVPARCW